MDEPTVYLVARGHSAEKRPACNSIPDAAAFVASEKQGRWIVVLDDLAHQGALVPRGSDAQSIEREIRDVWERAISD